VLFVGLFSSTELDEEYLPPRTEIEGKCFLPYACEAVTKKQRLSPSHEIEESMAPSSAHRCCYGGEDPPSSLIVLPALGGAREVGPLLTVVDAWEFWNSTLRDLDEWHKGLILDREGQTIRTNQGIWAGKWFLKYRYYREIGEEIDRRFKLRDGLSVEDIVERFRLFDYRSNTTPRFKDWLTVCVGVERGRDPFNKKRKKVIDISSELATQFPKARGQTLAE
jgi:hypothetical protein